jgi:hypothetical protein
MKKRRKGTIKICNKRFGSVTRKQYLNFFDAFAVLQKKGLQLTSTEELSDLLLHPDSSEVQGRHFHRTWVADGVVYAPSGEILVVSRERNPHVRRYLEKVTQFDERSFPDHPEYGRVLQDIREIDQFGVTLNELYAKQVNSHEKKHERVLRECGKFMGIREQKISTYASERGISAVYPEWFNTGSYRRREEAKQKRGEPYFISRIGDVGKFRSGFDVETGVSEQELADLIADSSEDVEQARKSGVLLVQREALNEVDPYVHERMMYEERGKPYSGPHVGNVCVPVGELSQHPVTSFLFGRNAERVAGQLSSRGGRTFTISLVHNEKMAKQERPAALPLKYMPREAHISGTGRDALYERSQVFGMKEAKR